MPRLALGRGASVRSSVSLPATPPNSDPPKWCAAQVRGGSSAVGRWPAEARPSGAVRRALGSPREGGGAGAGIANVELPAIARLAGGNSVSLPATTPNSAHLRPTRREYHSRPVA